MKNLVAHWQYSPLVLGLIVLPFVSAIWFFEPYDTTKWAVLYISTVVALIFLSLKGSFKLPRSNILFLAVLLFGTSLVQHLVLEISFFQRSLSDRLLFFVLCLVFYNLFSKRDFSWPIGLKILTGILLIVSIGSLYPIIRLDENGGQALDPFFGNVNMTAQFLAMGIILQLPQLKHRWAHTWVYEVSIAVSIAFLYFSFCRSAILGLLLSVFIFFMFQKKKLAFVL